MFQLRKKSPPAFAKQVPITSRGKKWFNISVHSVLKRKKQRNERVEQVRNQQFPTGMIQDEGQILHF